MKAKLKEGREMKKKKQGITPKKQKILKQDRQTGAERTLGFKNGYNQAVEDFKKWQEQ